MSKVKDGYVNLSVQNQNTALLEVYGVIGGDFYGDGISAKEVVAKIKEIPANTKNLVMHINSPGGSVTEGMAIYNRLKQLSPKMKITAKIDAIAASIASVIMLAADEIIMGETGFIMIHKPWSYAVGNADDLDKQIRILDEIEAQMLNLYIKKTKKSKVELQNMLADETWLNASEAFELGFVDQIEETQAVAACAVGKAHWLKTKPKNLVTIEAQAREKLKARLESAAILNKRR